ncbi:MAG: DMT family transporter [Minwuia sp.]|uniref:DMT family transporter n=1 Tax=Minwuia sp. TaxID=2493630 RepID=UPI003A8670D9
MRNPATLAYLAVLIGVFGHSTSEFVSVLTGVSGPEVSVWRYVLGGAGLLLFALARRRTRNFWRPLIDKPVATMLLSVFGIGMPMLLFHWALDYATVIQVATLTTTIPIWVAVTNAVVNRQPLGAGKIFTGIAAFLGIVVLLTNGYLERLAGDDDQLFGLFLGLACAATGSAYSVLVKPMILEYGGIRVMALNTVIGALSLWLVVGAAWGIWVDPTTLFDRPAEQALALATIGIWNTTIGMLLWFWGLAAVPDIARGSYLFFLKPVIAATLSLVFLSQPVSWLQFVAIGVICGSVALEFFWPRIAGRRKQEAV